MCRLGTDRLTSRCKFPAKETQSAEVRTLRQVGAFRAVRRHIPARDPGPPRLVAVAKRPRRASSSEPASSPAREQDTASRGPPRFHAFSTPRHISLLASKAREASSTMASSALASAAVGARALSAPRASSSASTRRVSPRALRRRRPLSRAERSSRRRFARPRSRAAASRAGVPAGPSASSPRRSPRPRRWPRRRGRGDRGDRVRGHLRGRDGRRDGRVVWGYFVLPVRGRLLQHRYVATIFISVGSSNVARAWRVFRFLASRVWSLVAATFAAVRASLKAEDQTWTDTRAVLEEA